MDKQKFYPGGKTRKSPKFQVELEAKSEPE